MKHSEVKKWSMHACIKIINGKKYALTMQVYRQVSLSKERYKKDQGGTISTAIFWND